MRDITLPKLNKELAEFIGILLGDGHLGPLKYEISVTGNSINEVEYIKGFVRNRMTDLFNIVPLIYYQKNCNAMRCKIYSKKVFEYLTNVFGLWQGNKMNYDLRIPTKIKNNDELLKACLRGLIDTDGGVFRHHKWCAQLQFYSKNESLANDVENSLIRLGYKPSKTKKSSGNIILYLFNKDIDTYFKEIGTNNYKNQLKYNIWKRDKIMPKTEGIEKLMSAPVV